MPRSQPGDKCKVVAAHLRAQIASGKLQPGSKLPKWEDLEAKFGVSRITISAAMRELQQNGFIRAARRSGTFVVDMPPNLTRFGLAFPFRTDQTPWTRFCTSLVNCIPLVAGPGRSVVVYQEANGNPEAEGWRQLKADIEAGTLAGLIVSNYGTALCSHPLLVNSGIPCVALRYEQDTTSMPICILDNHSLAEKAVAHLAAKGRSRLAVIAPSNKVLQEFVAPLRAHRLAHIPHFHITLGTYEAVSARHIVSLMMRLPRNERPDGLILADDNHVEYGLAGIVDAGIDANRDLDIVVHCNFPWPVPSILPVKRLGFDARLVLQTLFESLERSSRGQKNAISTIPAVFEDELGHLQAALSAA